MPGSIRGLAALGVAGSMAGWAARHASSPTARRWAPGAGRGRLAGRLRVRVFGTGDPVIALLHGLVASGDYFGAGFDRLGEHATVVIPDLLEFDDSPADPGLLAAADHLAALHDMLEALHLHRRPLITAGHSMGSILALRWAAELGGRVRAVVGICPPLYRDAAEADEGLRRMGRMEAFLAGDGPLPRAMCAWMCAHRTTASWLAVAARPDLPVPIARAAVKHTWDTYRGSLVDIIRNPAWEPALQHLGATGVPISLLEGAHDPVPVPGRAAELLAAVPVGTHRVRPHAGHYLPMTGAAWCATQIAAQARQPIREGSW
ncbi:alpha/beta fold hydrolase [Pseudonocardia sp. KRD-184]|uniref:Alpha/beta fold hydrolase n=1 Tax=Pseudonocardia oceani TaxID=2792013 RepID=A0ABS6U2U2_9PSEU|nr:alpha/beta fold hydrolase [Pseudonocardia oceani]MBW0090054.1 alpha/beta fold hydrolase [Pseudonocardia oceani]MBW0097209.1 alpha/beta fold hydrolase [Pseudonocardia oceani]MBW0120910.1 alpha/beta fold hydrolase [Pseudonocardia oceani]MBW0126548.1 alpha/beta fold hydrolase [Pseudonocardia oceani]